MAVIVYINYTLSHKLCTSSSHQHVATVLHRSDISHLFIGHMHKGGGDLDLNFNAMLALLS